MNNPSFIKKSLAEQGLPVIETDIPFIYLILNTMNAAEASLAKFPHLNMEVPITVVDKELLR